MQERLPAVGRESLGEMAHLAWGRELTWSEHQSIRQASMHVFTFVWLEDKIAKEAHLRMECGLDDL